MSIMRQASDNSQHMLIGSSPHHAATSGRAKRDVSRVFPHQFERTSHRRGVSQFPYIRAEGGLISLAPIAAPKPPENEK
jgi:hypothetical protein